MSLEVKVQLYIALVRSHCSPVWRHHMKDMHYQLNIELPYNLNDYTSDYRSWLIKIKLFILIYSLELSDIIFFITSIKNPISSVFFNINSCFINSSTRSNGQKLSHNPSFNNKQHYFYFNCICRVWNSLLIINLKLWKVTIKNHFSGNILLPTDSYKLHFLCLCSSCINRFWMNFNHI